MASAEMNAGFTTLLSTVEKPLTLDEMIIIYAQAVLHRCKGNKSEAARVLGIDRRSLYRLIEKYKLVRFEVSPDAPKPATLTPGHLIGTGLPE